MRIDQYASTMKEIERADFADALGISLFYLNEIVRGNRIPGKSLAKLIEYETNGMVTAVEARAEAECEN